MSFGIAVALAQFGASSTGELRITVSDATALAVPAATVVVRNDPNQIDLRLATSQDGTVVVRRLPFGAYTISIDHDGFAPFTAVVDIRSALPAELRAQLQLAPLASRVDVATTAAPLMDDRQTGALQRLGATAIGERTTSLPGRSLPDLVNTQPGWLLEANGILHPRGSEYQTQFVVDGLPLTDNRSPAFAPEIDADDVQGMNILTGGYPAEYGRKLGGVIEVTTAAQARRGFHGDVGASAGSFATATADAIAGYTFDRAMIAFSGGGARTDRYLDPPVEANFTNHGTTSHASARAEHDIGDGDRVGLIARYGRTTFEVPNEREQQDAGQLQQRWSDEWSAQGSYQRAISSSWLADARALVRDLSADLRSNSASTPIIVNQSRGLGEVYIRATASAHRGAHEWKFGADADFGDVREALDYRITDLRQFDRGTPPTFAFSDTGADREQAAFAQDQVHLGAWTVSAGVRWDHYRLRVDEQAVSPRVGVAWAWPDTGLVLRASYDRAFQTPAIENLLLASSPAVDSLNDAVIRLPVRPSRGDFFQIGGSKAVFGAARLDVDWYDRRVDNFADDDVLLNTGVSFPIAFSRADVHGAEVKLEVPHWRTLSGFVSYAWMRGVGELPVTGGLFLGDEASGQLDSAVSFPISQDQRHTLRARASWQAAPRAWVALAASYGSGLPFEFDGSPADALAQYGARILSRVDFDAGRVDPSFALDVSASVTLVHRSDRSLRLQVDLRNMTDRLNVINFAGLFSGTALGAPRSVACRVRADF